MAPIERSEFERGRDVPFGEPSNSNKQHTPICYRDMSMPWHAAACQDCGALHDGWVHQSQLGYID